MADQKEKPFMGFGKKEAPNEPNTAPPEPEADVPEMSLEDLDQFLATEDPEFSKKIKSIGEDKDLSLSIIDLDNLDEALFQETEKWRSGKLVRRLVFLAIPNVPKYSLKIKSFVFRFRNGIKNSKELTKAYFKYLTTEGRKKFFAWLKTQILALFQSLGQRIRKFKDLSIKAKISLFASVALVASTFFLAYLFSQTKLFHLNEELYINSLKEIGTSVFDYNPETEVEPFYDNIRSAPNLLMLEKLVVNLKKSKSSGDNPMAAFEFFVEGLTPEVIVEVKDKEVMVRDQVQRTIEQYSFDDLDSAEGKRDLTQALTREVSRNLTTGKLKAVRIKTMILKP